MTQFPFNLISLTNDNGSIFNFVWHSYNIKVSCTSCVGTKQFMHSLFNPTVNPLFASTTKAKQHFCLLTKLQLSDRLTGVMLAKYKKRVFGAQSVWRRHYQRRQVALFYPMASIALISSCSLLVSRFGQQIEEFCLRKIENGPRQLFLLSAAAGSILTLAPRRDPLPLYYVAPCLCLYRDMHFLAPASPAASTNTAPVCASIFSSFPRRRSKPFSLIYNQLINLMPGPLQNNV